MRMPASSPTTEQPMSWVLVEFEIIVMIHYTPATQSHTSIYDMRFIIV